MQDSHRSYRKCHKCGDRIKSRAICPSCGHTRCRRCQQVIPEDPTQRPSASGAGLSTETLTPAPAPRTPQRSSVPAIVRDQLEVADDPVKPTLKNEPVSPNTKRFSVRNNPFVIADQIAKAKLAEPQTSTQPARAAPSPKLRHSVSELGDQYGSAKRPSSTKKRSYERLEVSSTQNNDRMDSDSKSVPNTPNSGPISSASGGDIIDFIKPKKDVLVQIHNPPLAASPRRGDRSKSSNGIWEPSESSAASSSELSRVIKRVNVLAREPNSGKMEQVLEVNMEGLGGQNKGNGVPRVRVSSPPSWLKNPSTEPGSIQGRLKHIDDSAPAINPPRQSDSLRRQHHQRSDPEVKDFEVHDLYYRTRAPKAAHVEPANPSERDDEQASGSEGTPRPLNSPRKTLGSMISPGGAETTRRTTEATTSTAASGVTAAIANARAKMAERGSGSPPSRPLPGEYGKDQPHTRQWLDDIQQRHQRQNQAQERGSMKEGATMATPRRSYGQEAGQKGNSGDRSVRKSSVFKKSRLSEVSQGQRESDVRKARSLGILPGEGRKSDHIDVRGEENGGHIHDQDEDDVGIRGLTIVLHLRGKDDLVISTDLTREADKD